MEGGWPARGGVLLCLTVSLLLQGKGDAFTINCSGFDQHGVDPAAFQAVFDRKAFCPFTNYSIPTHVNISFTLSAILRVDAQLQLLTSFLWLMLVWDNPFISWNPKECVGINKLTVLAENLWLPDIFIMESMDVSQMPSGLTAYISSEGQIKYNKPMRVTSICNLDIFYFPFDQQNCTFTFSSFLHTVDGMLLGMDKEVWKITDTSHNVIRTQGEWELLGINKATPKMSMGNNLYDQIMFYVAIRHRPSLYIINLLVPSSFLIAIDALSFYLPAESENHAPFKITLLLGCNVFLLMMNDLLPASGNPFISVYFALSLSLMVGSLLETIFITYLLHVATTQPAPLPLWFHSLLLHCTSPGRCCPTAAWKGNKGLGLTPTHLPGTKEAGELTGKQLGPRETELDGGSGCTKTQLMEQWVQFSHAIDTLLYQTHFPYLSHLSPVTTMSPSKFQKLQHSTTKQVQDGPGQFPVCCSGCVFLLTFSLPELPPNSSLPDQWKSRSCGGGDVERKNIHFPWDVFLCSLEMNLMNHLAIFKQKAFCPVINSSLPAHVNISFTLSAILEVIWENPLSSWDPEEYGDINKLTVTAENPWFPDIFIMESWVPLGTYSLGTMNSSLPLAAHGPIGMHFLTSKAHESPRLSQS
ncbi:5-hydroxytryptamine receptor 3C [Macaca mulatta]